MRKSKSIYPAAVRLLRFVMPLLERAAPKIAEYIAVRLFLRPQKHIKHISSTAAVHGFRLKFFLINGNRIATYLKGEGPVVVFLHGWSGRGLQFRYMADALVNEGFKCVLIDAPAHGLSDGKQTDIFEISDAFVTISSNFSNIKAVVGHSLGAAVISYSIYEGSGFSAFVSIAAPVIAQDILDHFTNTINASSEIQSAIRSKAVERYGKSFDEVAMQNTFKGVACPVLALHGERDRDVPAEHLDVLKRINPQIKTVRFSDVGHRGILKRSESVQVIVDWVKSLE